jgi:two-component system sensor histidine kinase KdpD
MAADVIDNRFAAPAGTRSTLGTLLRLCVPLAVVAASTWLAVHFRLNLATMGFLYLILVIATAMRGGFWFATVASIVSAGCLNYFFVPPTYSFSVSDPANWVALGAFELTALVISRLSNTASQRAAEAIRERREAERLYQISLQIFLLDRTQDPGNILASVIREVFELKAVALFDAMSGNTYTAGAETFAAEERARQAFVRDSNEFDPAEQSWFCSLRADRRPAGGLALCGCAMRPLTAAALASLCAISFERFRSLDREYRAEAARRTEQLRTAVLDSLAHQIKTPVATIWAASSGLLALGGLSETQEVLMNLLDEQSKRLSDIASQLLKTAKLDTPTIALKHELLRLSDVVDETLQTLDLQQSETRLRVSCPAEEQPVLGDRRLIFDALGQIVDNAFKYSAPGTPIDIQVENRGGVEATVSVRNEGPAIHPSDRERIFERFYRANAARQGPSGSGLGLSIVKRIVEAHAGRVWVESQSGRTAFFLALPLASPEAVAAVHLPDAEAE